DSISLVKPSTPAERGRRWRRWSAALRWANHEVAKSTKKFLNSKYGLGISRELLYKQKDLGRDAQATQSQAGSMLRALRDSWLTLPSVYPFAKPNARRRMARHGGSTDRSALPQRRLQQGGRGGAQRHRLPGVLQRSARSPRAGEAARDGL